MLDGMPAVRVKAEPLESERGVREHPPQHSSFFLAFLAVVLSLSKGLIITPRPMQVSMSVGAKEEWCMVLSRKGRRARKRRRATAGTGMLWGVWGEVIGASKEPVLAEGDYADVIALQGWRPPGNQSFKISCQSLRLCTNVFTGHAPVVYWLIGPRISPSYTNAKTPTKLTIFLY